MTVASVANAETQIKIMETQQPSSPKLVAVVDPANSHLAPFSPNKASMSIAKGQNSVLSSSRGAGAKKANNRGASKLFFLVGRKQSRRSTELAEDLSNNTGSTAFFSTTAGELTEDEFDVSSGGSSSRSSCERSSSTSPELPLQRQRAGCLKVRTQNKSLARRYGGTGTTQSSHNNSTANRSVSWNAIQIHTHEVVLGDNPAVSVGPPLSLGWARWQSERLSIDDYEMQRPKRRRSDGLRVPRSERERLLMQEFGVARSHMVETINWINKIKLHRRANAKRGPLEVIRDAFENRRSVTGRKVHEKP